MIDVLVDLQKGDCGKGKVSKILLERIKYKNVCKFNGSGNSGHTVVVDDKEYIAHYLTSGLYREDTNIIIGPGCVIDINKLSLEISDFESKGFDLNNRVFVCSNTHVITEDHVKEDSKDTFIGTTKQGTGPCYRDKYSRTGYRCKDLIDENSFQNFRLIDNLGIFDRDDFKGITLMEGSQGFWLDIDHGNYPYVTSSHIHPAHAFTSFGIPISRCNIIYGVAKLYETYSGYADLNFLDDNEKAFSNFVVNNGKEYGATTGRERKVRYLNLDRLLEAIKATGVNVLIFNKCDIMKNYYNNILGESDSYLGLIHKDDLVKFNNYEDFIEYVDTIAFTDSNFDIDEVLYSGDPEGEDLKEFL